MKFSHVVRQSAQRGILREEPAVIVKNQEPKQQHSTTDPKP